MRARGPNRPAITGKQLIRLLEKDGWVLGRKTRHGVSLSKAFSGRHRVTVVPDKRRSLVPKTLAEILGPKQTSLGREGLLDLISRYGLD